MREMWHGINLQCNVNIIAKIISKLGNKGIFQRE